MNDALLELRLRWNGLQARAYHVHITCVPCAWLLQLQLRRRSRRAAAAVGAPVPHPRPRPRPHLRPDLRLRPHPNLRPHPRLTSALTSTLTSTLTLLTYIYIYIRTAGRAPSARGSRSTACSEISISSTTQSRTRAARRSPPGCATTARCERWLSSTTGCRAPWARRCGQRSRCGSVVKVPRLAAPQLGSCASSGRAWRPLAALGSLVRPGRRRPTGRPATASGARASHLQRLSRRLHRL